MLQHDIIDGTYQLIRQIGQGGTGVIYLAYHLRLRKYVALKKSTLRAADMEYLRTEVDTLKELHHPMLPQVYDFLQIDGDIFTVIDYIDGEDCEHIISAGYRFSEEQLAGYLLDLTKALTYLHQHDPPVLHSDIKPGNIMIRKDGSVVLIDFNIAVSMDMGSSIKGYTSYYASPEQKRLAEEVLSGIQPVTKLDERSDIYSLGATFYFLMTGTPPENSAVPLKTLQAGYSPEFARIIDQAMHVDCEKRFQTAIEMQRKLEKFLRRGSDFRKKCILQAGALLIAGMLICGGIWSILYGSAQKRSQEFSAVYSEVYQELQFGDYEQAISGGIRGLNDFPDQRDASPRKWFYLLRFIGESYRALAYDTQIQQEKVQMLQQAAIYYFDAVEITLAENLEEKETMVNMCAALLLELEDVEKLKKLTSMTQTAGIETSQILSGQLLAVEGNPKAAESLLMLYLEVATTPVYRAQTYQAMAGIVGETTWEGIAYLEQAVNEHPDADIYRTLAKSYMDMAEMCDAETAIDCYRRAADYYECLADSGYYTDRLGHLIALRACEDYTVAEQVLEKLENQYPNRFEVLAQGAILKDQMGQSLDAKQYAAAAKAVASEYDVAAHEDVWTVICRIINEV